MGGFGSGPQYGSRYSRIERALRLDATHLRHVGLFQSGKCARGVWGWKWLDGADASAEVEVDLTEDPGTYRLQYRVPAGEAIDIGGQLYNENARFGGVRYWLACPRCWRRTRVIFLPPGAICFACRRCHRLRYASQSEGDADRLQRKARKLWRRAGSEDGLEPWQKPKWMRWATFSRLVLEGRAADEAALWAIPMSASIARRIGRTG
jgi:hypothetical protein